MSQNDLKRIFEFLNENYNPNNDLYFKLIDEKLIGAYFSIDNSPFAEFYITKILKMMKIKK